MVCRSPATTSSEEATQTWRREGPWRSASARNARRCAIAAGILDLPGFSRFRSRAPGARTGWRASITGPVPKPGRIGLGYFADDSGRIVTEMSIMALDEDEFLLITAAAAQWHDCEWLRKASARRLRHRRSRRDGPLSPARSSPGPQAARSSPRSRDADLALAWLTHQAAADRRPRGAGWCASPSPANSAGKSTRKVERYRRDLRRGLGGGPEARLQALRHVRAGLACASRRAIAPGRATCRPTTPSCRAGSSASSTGTSRTSAARRRCSGEAAGRGEALRHADRRGRATATRPTCRRSGMAARWSARPRRAAGATGSAGRSRWACCGPTSP